MTMSFIEFTKKSIPYFAILTAAVLLDLWLDTHIFRDLYTGSLIAQVVITKNENKKEAS